MAITVSSAPAALVMAGNPVIIQGTSTITSSKFPVILGKFTCGSYVEEYTYPLGSDGKFQFDLSDALQECFRQDQTVSQSSGGVPSHTPSVKSYTFVLSEQYYLDGVTYVDNNTKQTINNKKAIPGALTDRERWLMSGENIATTLGSSHLLTRRPIGDDIAVEGSQIVIPKYSNTPSLSYASYLAEGTFSGTGANRHRTSRSQTVEGRTFYVPEDDGHYIPLIFWNGFGLLESACGYGNMILQHNFASSQYTVQPESRGFHTIGTKKSITNIDSQTITISSGIVNRDWYEWWCSEVITSPQIFIKLQGKWLSATIIPESIKLETAKCEALSVTFNIQLSITGSLHNIFS